VQQVLQHHAPLVPARTRRSLPSSTP
jgi:hypothetical protein